MSSGSIISVDKNNRPIVQILEKKENINHPIPDNFLNLKEKELMISLYHLNEIKKIFNIDNNNINSLLSLIPAYTEDTFYMAAKYGDVIKLNDLLVANPNLVNRVNNKGYTALHLSAYYGHLDCVFILMSFNADINVRNRFGETPLKIAFYKFKNAKKTHIKKKYKAIIRVIAKDRCIYKDHCFEGFKCQFYHTKEEKEIFKVRKRRMSYKVELCPIFNCKHRGKNSFRCPYAHSKSERWCLRCNDYGHFEQDCKEKINKLKFK